MKQDTSTKTRSGMGAPPCEGPGEATIGIFGGSFNPIHTGHIELARQLRRVLKLDEVWLMVTPLNPFKSKETDLLRDDLRLSLAKEALKNEPHIHAHKDEFLLPKPSYTWQTLQYLRKKYPEKHFILLIGADNWLAFDRWREYKQIIATTPIVVYPREGYSIDPASLPTAGDDGLPSVTVVDTPLYPISSTEVRRRIRLRQPLSGLVPRHIISQTRRLYLPFLRMLDARDAHKN